MKERLRELGIKTTELSSYMKISRPSLYKYLNMYEEKDLKGIPEGVLRTFRYIDKYRKLTKEQVISFVILEFSDDEDSDYKETIKKYLLSKGLKDSKIEFMYNLVTTDYFDGIVDYFNNVTLILKKEEIDDDGLYQIARLVNLKNDVMKDVPITKDELNKAKTIVGERYV
ncbi:MAG: hypothetical protein E7Z64_03260 [Thermoplasmata archaeon]|nr:hypothetical protein [Thermoplasmata archaeon]